MEQGFGLFSSGALHPWVTAAGKCGDDGANARDSARGKGRWQRETPPGEEFGLLKSKKLRPSLY